MAARRLIIVMLFLLAISTAIAIVVPEPREPDQQEEPSETGTTGPTGSTGPGGPGSDVPREPGDPAGDGLVEATVEPDTETRVVRAAAGDRLVLTIETAEPAVVEIADLGLTQTTSRYAPAVFDLLVPEKPAKIEVTTAGDGRTVATISSRR